VPPRPSLVALPLTALVLCSCSGTSPTRTVATPVVPVGTAAPGPLGVVSEADPIAAGVDVSRALFRTAPVVAVARDGDEAGTLLGASAAVALGVPLLVQPAGPPREELTGELVRLHATTVLAVGPVDGRALQTDRPRTVLPVAATPEALGRAGVPLGRPRPVASADAVRAVSELGPEGTSALRTAGGGAPATSPTTAADATPSSRLPRVTRGEPQDTTVVLVTGEPGSLAGVATARAAGARVQLTGGASDPRASAAVVTALSRSRPHAVLALGAAFAGEGGLAWELATAETGRQLPGGGQLLFPGRTLVALYGTPGTGALGVLGEQDLPATLRRARDTAAPYTALVPGPVVPTLEIIATIASASPGPDGNYSSETDPEQLRPWVEAAGRAGIYVVLDLQPGRSDFLGQAQRYRSLLEQPGVGLALDPEWRLGPGQLPLDQIGSVDVAEVNQVSTWLADLTRSEALPQKLLVLHQFGLGMIRGRDRLDTSRSELAVTLHADGQGAQPTKQDTWQALHQDPPPGPLFWGWKNFYDEDLPTLTPDQTIAQVHPAPNLISYQ
jgi:hypothetical protein